MSKKKMLQFSPDLSIFLEKKLEDFGIQAEKKKMFGHETFFLNGYMFSGANITGIFVQVGKEARDIALEKEKEKGIAPFEPMEGMVMKDYLLLLKQVYSREKEFKKWIEQSSSYLLALPPKTKKNKKKK